MPIQIGMLTVSLPPALSTVPAEAVGIADELSAQAAARLTDRGCEVRRIEGQQQSESAVLDAVKQLEDANVDCVVFVIGSWIYVPMVVTAARKLTKPFVLWGLTHMVLSASVSSCITHGGLDELGIKHKFVFGMPDEDEIIDEIMLFAGLDCSRFSWTTKGMVKTEVERGSAHLEVEGWGERNRE